LNRLGLGSGFGERVGSFWKMRPRKLLGLGWVAGVGLTYWGGACGRSGPGYGMGGGEERVDRGMWWEGMGIEFEVRGDSLAAAATLCRSEG